MSDNQKFFKFIVQIWTSLVVNLNLKKRNIFKKDLNFLCIDQMFFFYQPGNPFFKSLNVLICGWDTPSSKMHSGEGPRVDYP